MDIKKRYLKPSIVRIGNPMYSKHGKSVQSQFPVREKIDGNSISNLTKEFGSPLFVFSEDLIRKKYQRAYKAFKSNYSNVEFAWSYKTNYLNAICNLYHDMGSLAEVVSEFEYEKAIANGVNGKNIIFNGPKKSKKVLKDAVLNGSKIHIDHTGEISDLEVIADELGIAPQVGIRINLECGIFPVWSRFGFNYETGQAFAAIERIQRGGKLNLVGIHCHIGTYIFDSKAYTRAMEKLIHLSKTIHSQFKQEIEYIDIGGGIPSHAHLKGVYQPPEIAVPEIEEYAQAIIEPLEREFGQSGPKLIMEMGRHLIDDAGFLLSSVVSVKGQPDGKRAYVIDAGVNLLYTSSWYRHKIELSQPKPDFSVPSIFYGPLCMNIDVVQDSILIPSLSIGDQIVLNPVGAYNVTQWMQFIEYRPAVVMIDSKSKPHLIRRRETLESLNGLEVELVKEEKIEECRMNPLENIA